MSEYDNGEAAEERNGFFSKLSAGLSKTRKSIMGGVDGVLKTFVKIDDDLFEELEETLIMSDFGIKSSDEIITKLKESVKSNRIADADSVKSALARIVAEIMSDDGESSLPSPCVVLVVGVNGVGKTTTIGKLASMFVSDGKKVIIAAADTFRAAAAEQLEIWAERADAPLIRQDEGSDPGAVVFDAVNAAKARRADILLIDTAGRLHNKKNLMDELGKINKIIDGKFPEAHKETYIVLDATAGQNSLQQVKAFGEFCGVSGIILTKLDGTAKGGIAAAIKAELGVPVKYVGVGEGIDDLQRFDAHSFANAIFYGGV